ncbi:MAG: MFS transporter [Elusimicrobia bacterium]|nr:MFS transporter [Elusimicrobiota bacterium]
MLRAALALLLCISCWEPAVAGAVSQVVVSRGAASPVVPLISAGAPISGLTNGSLSGLHASLTGGLSSTLSPVPSVITAPAAPAALQSLSAAPRTLAVEPAAPAGIPAQTPGAVQSALGAVSQVSAEFSRTAAPSGGATSATTPNQSPVLDRFYDGGVKTSLPVEPVAAIVPGGPAPMATLQKAQAQAAAKPQVPAAAEAAKQKAARQALLGTGIYKFGMEALNVAMPLIALTVFGSAVWMATMAVAWGASMTLSSMFAGGLIDRKPVQKVLAGALVTQAAAVGGIIALLTLGLTNPWLVLPLYALAGVTQGVVLTARDTLPARILGRDAAVLSKFNAKTHMVYEVSGTIAPLLVGLLIAKLGVVAGLFLLPPAYLLAAWAFSRLKLHASMDVSRELRAEDRGVKNAVKRVASEIREGAHIILGSTEFRWLGFMLLGPMVVHRVFEQILVPVFTKGILGVAAKSAWVVSASNFGELLGALLLLRVLMNSDGGKKTSPFRWIRAMALGTLAVWALAGGLSLPVIMVLTAVMSTTWAANDISMTSYFQSRLPNESAGKAVGFLMAVELGTIMVLSYLLGFLFDFLPISAGIIGVSVAATFLAALFYRGYSKLRSTQAQKPKA